MNKYPSYSHRNRWSRNQNSARYRATTFAFGNISSILLFSIIVGVLGLLYLTQITKTSVYGYQVNTLSERKNELVQENQALKVEAARLQALERIRSSQVAAELVPETDRSFSEGTLN